MVGSQLALSAAFIKWNEPGELSQCSKHDDRTINIILLIIIINYYYKQQWTVVAQQLIMLDEQQYTERAALPGRIENQSYDTFASALTVCIKHRAVPGHLQL